MDALRRRLMLSTAAALSPSLLLPGSAVAQGSTAAAMPRTLFGFTLGSSAATLYADMTRELRQRDASLGALIAPTLTQRSGTSGSRAIEEVDAGSRQVDAPKQVALHELTEAPGV